MVVLNKRDLVETKLARHVKMRDHFPQYTGRNSTPDVLDFIETLFRGIKTHTITFVQTCATDAPSAVSAAKSLATVMFCAYQDSIMNPNGGLCITSGL